MKDLFQKYRYYLGFTTAVTGGGLMLEHYISNGYLVHWPVSGLVIDHGVVGILLVILGGILAAGKPGAKRNA